MAELNIPLALLTSN